MTQNFTLHCHTNFSDGSNTAEEMVDAAIRKGFSFMGITDHLIVHKNIKQSPLWKRLSQKSNTHVYNSEFKSILPLFQRHCEELRKLAKQKNFRILVGFEVDFFTYDGWLDELKDFLTKLDYDYLISGNHFLFDEKCETIYDIYRLLVDDCDSEKLQEMFSKHFRTIKMAAESELFKFIAHLDYVKKINWQFNEADFKEEKSAIIKALKECGVGTEISTKGLRKIGCFYPDDWFLNEIKKNNIEIVISDDAHNIDELGYDFNKAEEKLKEIGITDRIKI